MSDDTRRYTSDMKFLNARLSEWKVKRGSNATKSSSSSRRFLFAWFLLLHQLNKFQQGFMQTEKSIAPSNAHVSNS